MSKIITEGTGMRILLAAGGIPEGANVPQSQYMRDSTGQRIAEALENGGGGLPSGGTAGQVLGLDSDLEPVWIDVPDSIEEGGAWT